MMKNIFFFLLKDTSRVVLLFIIFIALSFRFYHFPSNPPALNWDEVAIGYNAQSILKTGRDEFGKFMPLSFRSFDDYKMPVYVYITVLSEQLFGYNDFAVRFPAAFFGIISVIILYFLVLEIAKRKEIALLSALFLAILPWHIQFTRYALEASVALCFVLAGILCFIYGVRKNQKYFIFSSIFFGLSMFTYLSFRVLAVPIVLLLIVLFWKKIHKTALWYLSIGIFVLFISLVLFQTVTEKGNVRFKGIAVFNEPQIFDAEYKRIAYEGSLNINIPRRLFHQPVYLNAQLVMRGYLTHFYSDFLFFDRGKLHLTPNAGLLYLWMICLIPSGMYFAVRILSKKSVVLLFALMILAPIPASVTSDIPHAIRSILLIIPFSIFSAIGYWGIYEYIRKKHFASHLFFIAISIFVVTISSWNYFRQYQIHLPHERSQEWLYGRQEMTEYLESVKDNYEYIVISPRVEWPYIFMLYYSKYNPQNYLDQGGTQSGFWDAQNNSYDKFKIRKLSDEDKDNHVLFVDIPVDIPESVRKIHSIQYLDGSEALVFIETSS